MQFDPKTRSLYTDHGELIKTLACPEGKTWTELRPARDGARVCDHCRRQVHDTSSLTEQQVVALVSENPDACLAVSPTQANCTIVPLLMQGKRRRIRQ